MREIDAASLKAWQDALHWFLQCMTFATDRQLVLKSPTHTARIALLAEMFPRAKFLHIVRDPQTLFASTIRLWRVLDHAQGLQLPHFRDLEAYVIDAFCRMYTAFERDRRDLSADRIHDVRYEDLVRDPLGELERAYARLALGDFAEVRSSLQAFTSSKREYQTNRYQLNEETRQKIEQAWGFYAERYGYQLEQP
jgi:hypothetical protein